MFRALFLFIVLPLVFGVAAAEANRSNLILKTKPVQGMASMNWINMLRMTLAGHDYVIEQVFTNLEKFLPEDREKLAKYHVIHFTKELSIKDAQSVLTKVSSIPLIAQAMYEPKWEDAVVKTANLPGPVLPDDKTTADFEKRQSFLDAAPRGIDARYGWQFEGGYGRGIHVIDVETGWHKNHEDLSPMNWFFGKETISNHGTAVWGILAGKRDGRGITGIVPEIEFSGSSVSGSTTIDDWKKNFMPKAVEAAVLKAQPGDVLVIEQHGPGPDSELFGQNKYTAVEYYDIVFDLLKAATNRGIWCVAAAGNGNSNLDGIVYEGAFDLSKRDSGCILVGALYGPERGEGLHLTKPDFSNYGSRIDAAGYGYDVVTTGYGDLQSSEDGSKSYTKEFSGTSSATPIVTGAVVQILGMAKAMNRSLSIHELRKALRETGTAQKNPTKRAGSLPNIRELKAKLIGD